MCLGHKGKPTGPDKQSSECVYLDLIVPVMFCVSVLVTVCDWDQRNDWFLQSSLSQNFCHNLPSEISHAVPTLTHTHNIIIKYYIHYRNFIDFSRSGHHQGLKLTFCSPASHCGLGVSFSGFIQWFHLVVFQSY